MVKVPSGAKLKLGTHSVMSEQPYLHKCMHKSSGAVRWRGSGGRAAFLCNGKNAGPALWMTEAK